MADARSAACRHTTTEVRGGKVKCLSCGHSWRDFLIWSSRGNGNSHPGRPTSSAAAPLDTAGVLWVAAIDRVPIEDRIEWVKMMEERVASINEMRASSAARKRRQ